MTEAGHAERERAGRVVVESLSRLPRVAAAWIVEEVVRAVALRGRCSLALAGGSTPRPVYQALASAPLSSSVPWDRVEIFFGDERAVSRDHAESNYRSAREALLDSVPISEARVHSMDAAARDRDAAARAYDRLLPDRLDVLVLGMGPDGHTASLFPESPALAERIRRVVPVTSPKPPPARLTITPPVIDDARAICVLATGAEKAAMVARALRGPWEPDRVPAQLARRGTWFLDPAAAASLSLPARTS